MLPGVKIIPVQSYRGGRNVPVLLLPHKSNTIIHALFQDNIINREVIFSLKLLLVIWYYMLFRIY